MEAVLVFDAISGRPKQAIAESPNEPRERWLVKPVGSWPSKLVLFPIMEEVEISMLSARSPGLSEMPAAWALN